VAAVMACLDGARTVLGPATGIYGFPEVIAAARAGGHAEYFWQCGRRSDVGPGVHLYQRNNEQRQVDGITCDVNDVLIADWGYTPTSTTGSVRPEDDDDMFIVTSAGKPAFFIAGGVRTGLNESADLRAIRDAAARAGAPLPTFNLDLDTYNKFIRNYPGS
jgi:hypothetical protein